MRKTIAMACLLVAVLAALMGTANAAVAQDSPPAAASDESSPANLAAETGGIGGVIESGLFVLNEEGEPIELTDVPSIESDLVVLAQEDISKQVFFYLFTRQNPSESQTLIPGDADTLKNSNWKSDRPTRIVTHGWQSSSKQEVCTSIRDAFLKEGDYNVILVDWSKIASSLNYGYAARRVGFVGTYVGVMIDFLKTNGMDNSKLVVVGHSLGGHVAGLSSHYAKNKAGYVVALDPAGPLFGSAGPGERVDKSDAPNVQVIHTNQGKLGLEKSVGHMDFRPNGGARQVGCALTAIACSHSRAYQYYAESILTNVGFIGQLCGSWDDWQAKKCRTAASLLMGGSLPVPVSLLGNYYLATAESPPFAKGPPS